MTIVFTGNGNLGCKVYGDAEFMLALFEICTILQIFQRFVFCHHTKIGCDVILAVYCIHMREFVACIEWEFPVVAGQICGAVFQHGIMFMLYHAANEWLG